MIKNIKTNGVFLRRLYPKVEELITWEVLSEDKKIRYGIIRQSIDHYRIKSVGWRTFKIKFWLGSRFYPSKIFVANTRKEIIDLVKNLR